MILNYLEMYNRFSSAETKVQKNSKCSITSRQPPFDTNPCWVQLLLSVQRSVHEKKVVKTAQNCPTIYYFTVLAQFKMSGYKSFIFRPPLKLSNLALNSLNLMYFLCSTIKFTLFLMILLAVCLS